MCTSGSNSIRTQNFMVPITMAMVLLAGVPLIYMAFSNKLESACSSIVNSVIMPFSSLPIWSVRNGVSGRPELVCPYYV